MHHVLSMNNQDNKAFELALATKGVINSLSRFREAQHRVIYQLSNPSLAFGYEFSKSGEDMEFCRIQLAEAIDVADKLSWDAIYEHHNKDKNNA